MPSVFFIEIKPFIHLYDISTREKANQQIRDGFVNIIGGNIVIFPFTSTRRRQIARDAMLVTDVAPADRWSYELLEENGELRLSSR